MHDDSNEPGYLLSSRREYRTLVAAIVEELADAIDLSIDLTEMFSGLDTESLVLEPPLAHVLEAALLLADSVEFRNIDSDTPFRSALRDLANIAGLWETAIGEQLQKFPLAGITSHQLENEFWCPACPSAAMEIARLPYDKDVCDELVKIASSEVTYAAAIIRVANSSLHHHLAEVSTVQGGVIRIGADLTRQVLMAMALKSLYRAPDAELSTIWVHSIEVGRMCQWLAKSSLAVNIDPQEAQLAGLVHDIGRIASHHFAAKPLKRLLRRGVALTDAEVLSLGETHAELGGRILKQWNFPLRIVEAVIGHHRWQDVSDMPMTTLLFLAEEICAKPPEAIVPSAQIRSAAAKLGLGVEAITCTESEHERAWLETARIFLAN